MTDLAEEAKAETVADSVGLDPFAPIRQRMQELSDAADGLYHAAKRDCPGIPEPMGWILNQAAMRATWERFHAITDRKREPFRSIMLRNPYSKYMKFMYESYPPGFGDEIIQAYKEERPFDGAVVYYRLMFD